MIDRLKDELAAAKRVVKEAERLNPPQGSALREYRKTVTHYMCAASQVELDQLERARKEEDRQLDAERINRRTDAYITRLLRISELSQILIACADNP